MRNYYTICIENQCIKNNINLFCTLGQANKAFYSLSLALSCNKDGWQKITLSVRTKYGFNALNVARFTGVVNV